MAGAKDSIFKEKFTPYIRAQMDSLLETNGRDSAGYRALELQYIKSSAEDSYEEISRTRHYESEVHVEFDGEPLKGVERLYKRTILIEPSSVCAAHCRWCLRGQYPLFNLKKEEITNFAKYCGSAGVRDDLREILITGGDPLMVPPRLAFIFEEVGKYAPNIDFFRIGTRVPVQDPKRIKSELLSILKSAPGRVEIGTHINHSAEITEDARRAYADLQDVVFKIYDQSVLLKGVNDSFEALDELYDKLRYMGIEAHYLFHCIPMRGMSHHRTSIKKGLELISRITSSGSFSGRSKPMFTLMTDIGKITLYHGSILERNDKNEVLIQSKYTVDEFRYRNPSWEIPAAASLDENGYLRVWYPDVDDGEVLLDSEARSSEGKLTGQAARAAL